ncbi:hypothetical protein MUK72_15135 (plasmid) [Halococcus dombrowskii]|uniref:Uncharacterized protein n=1 Tax=Halococcus dombrowskii TaxID=179637 RepID=A0AAV3SC88_HALDO|nr:hypothetical protein [Halococcus dombrowskii]UOO96853.1 hypothetical protein MUK72_15135 [Halococcus dombrowskii]
MSEKENPSSGMQEDNSDVQPYVDAADRIERTLDAQIQKIQDVDSRAGFITRLVAILLGVIVSVVSVLVTLSANDGGTILPLSNVTAAAGIIASLGLLGAMVMGIITYLSSRQAAGLGHETADMLSEPEFQIAMEDHLKTTLAAYDVALQTNERIIKMNAIRLRYTLTLLVIGVVYGTVTAASLVVGAGGVSVTLLIVTTIVMGTVVWYIITGKYKPKQPQVEDINE